jgi:hypothetical protein
MDVDAGAGLIKILENLGFVNFNRERMLLKEESVAAISALFFFFRESEKALTRHPEIRLVASINRSGNNNIPFRGKKNRNLVEMGSISHGDTHSTVHFDTSIPTISEAAIHNKVKKCSIKLDSFSSNNISLKFQ